MKGVLAAAGLARGAYAARLGAFKRAALVVFNPAGEFRQEATDTPLAYLLDMRCAQLLGAKTAFVNVTIESDDPILNQLIVHVLANADLIAFRDSSSLDRYRTAGGKKEVLVLPDAVVLVPHEAKSRPARQRKHVAIALDATRVSDQMKPTLARLIDDLQDADFTVSWVSNEWTTDERFWSRLPVRRPIGSVGQIHGYKRYMEVLAGFDVVISARLHTCVLAMNAGTAIVPLEGNTCKVSGFFTEIGRGEQVIAWSLPEWGSLVRRRVEEIQADRATELARWKFHRDGAVARIQDPLFPRLRSVLDGASGWSDIGPSGLSRSAGRGKTAA